MSNFTVERIAIAWLVSSLEKNGVRAAFPELDTGIDLIAFEDEFRFRAVPIQVKSFSDEGFYTNRKYLKKPGLKIVYLWHLTNFDRIVAFCLPYEQAEAIVDNQKRSRKNGIYYTKATSRIKEALEPFLVHDWKVALFEK